MSDVTQNLSAMAHGQTGAAEQLLPLVYDELRSRFWALSRAWLFRKLSK